MSGKKMAQRMHGELAEVINHPIIMLIIAAVAVVLFVTFWVSIEQDNFAEEQKQTERLHPVLEQETCVSYECVIEATKACQKRSTIRLDEAKNRNPPQIEIYHYKGWEDGVCDFTKLIIEGDQRTETNCAIRLRMAEELTVNTLDNYCRGGLR